ncbi:MAG: hypothetical protein ACFCU7_09560 [Pleurocapsa sp.]
MLNLSFYSSNYRSPSFHNEVTDTEIGYRQRKLRLPRHISSLESKARVNASNLGKINPQSKIASLNLDFQEVEAIDLAVSILKYQLKDFASKQKHLENIRCNLRHRLQVAQMQGNIKLVHILQEEFKQLELSSF